MPEKWKHFRTVNTYLSILPSVPRRAAISLLLFLLPAACLPACLPLCCLWHCFQISHSDYCRRDSQASVSEYVYVNQNLYCCDLQLVISS